MEKSRNIIRVIDDLKTELDALRPLPADVVGRVAQKLRIESNYHSNAIEGNTLTLGETRNLIMNGLTARGKPMRDHVDIQGHNDAVKLIEEAVANSTRMDEAFILGLHRILLKDPYDPRPPGPDGRPTGGMVVPGQYKQVRNYVKTTTGETLYFTDPDQVPTAIGDLLDWYRHKEAEGEHPIIVAATFHHKFVRIHPFADGNGRVARLLMNMILIRHGYTVAIIEMNSRDRYIRAIQDVDKTGDPAGFIEFVASCCQYPLKLHLKAVRGDTIDDPGEIDREIELFKRSLTGQAQPDATVAGKQYVEEIVLPFKRYCLRKLALLTPDVFASVVEDFSRTSGTQSDGAPFSCWLDEDGVEKGLSIPDSVGYMDVEVSFMLSDCYVAGKSVDLEVKIDSEYDATRSSWRLEASAGSPTDSYVGRIEGNDLKALKAQFNDLLRWMMKHLSSLKD